LVTKWAFLPQLARTERQFDALYLRHPAGVPGGLQQIAY
jgi:hypothetical protein